MTEENKIINKKVFCKTLDGFGFAPVQTEKYNWVVMMFESQEKFNNNEPIRDFLFRIEGLSDFKSCWIIATRFKQEIDSIIVGTDKWNNKYKKSTDIRAKQWYEWGRLD